MLIVMAMMKDGLSHAEACSKIWLIDSNGLLIKNRSDGGITGHKVQFAKDNPPMNKLNEIVRLVKPTVLIGKFLLSSRCFHHSPIFRVVHYDSWAKWNLKCESFISLLRCRCCRCRWCFHTRNPKRHGHFQRTTRHLRSQQPNHQSGMHSWTSLWTHWCIIHYYHYYIEKCYT